MAPGDSSQSDISRLQTMLALTFEFSSDDLAANRRGELSAAQKERISRVHFANSRLAWGAFTIIFGLGLLGFSAEMIRTGQMGARSLLIYAGVTAFIGLVVGAFVHFYRWQLHRTLQRGEVRVVEGQIRLTMERIEKTYHRYFNVGTDRFLIEEYRKFALLQESGVVGRRAIAYVSAPWHGLLSVVLQESAWNSNSMSAPDQGARHLKKNCLDG